ncbi:MAG: discoidin domain-containing protein [Tannerellaceae bacterium]
MNCVSTKKLVLGLVAYHLSCSFGAECNAQNASSTLSWPKGQAMPHFTHPAPTLDGLFVADENISPTERIMFCALQGIVNKTQPRIFLFEHVQEGKYKWPDLLHLRIEEMHVDHKWELIRKYKNELSGLILYSTDKSEHYANLASTVAGIKGALPVTDKELQALRKQGITLPVVDDFTHLTYATPVEIYQYLYDNYWDACNKRLLVSHRPLMGYVRDLGVASGCAIVWLDPRNSIENTMIRKFLKDMQPGESIITGWWAEERSGIGVGVEYGISTIPSDFYENTTVYAGMHHQINMPAVPKKPEIDNKVYLAIFLSDGDNVQYCQHAMSRLWDNKGRGSIPINWTVSPGLVDMGPGLLNYYYSTATPNDFFAAGPSGLGYALIYDAHNRVWNSSKQSDFVPYANLTQQYLEKSGLRVITVWDEVNQAQMNVFADKCRYLYGVTQQDWERREKLHPVNIQNKLPFVPNLPCYAENVDVIYSFWQDTIAGFDKQQPIFLSAQGKSWELGPDQIVELKAKLEKLSPGNIEICRGDHFFALYNEANNMDFNLTLQPTVKITGSKTETDHSYASDGTTAKDRMWVSAAKDGQWLEYDLKQPYTISRYVIRHAGAGGASPSLNTRSYGVEVSLDGKQWVCVDKQMANQQHVSDIDITPIKARFVKFTITDPGIDGVARIADIEIYGKNN